jgi:hypothetical protein
MSDDRELKSVVPCTAELGKAVANVLTRDTVSRGYTWNGPNVHFSRRPHSSRRCSDQLGQAALGPFRRAAGVSESTIRVSENQSLPVAGGRDTPARSATSISLIARPKNQQRKLSFVTNLNQ